MDGNCLSLSITPPSRFRYLPRNKNLRSRGARATRPPHGAGASLQSLWDVGTLVLTRLASGLLATLSSGSPPAARLRGPRTQALRSRAAAGLWGAPARRRAAAGRGAESRATGRPGSVSSPFRPLLLGSCPDSRRLGPAARRTPRRSFPAGGSNTGPPAGVSFFSS